MNIVIIDQKNTAYQQNKIKGGIEFIVDCQLKMLSDKGHDVTFMTHSNSDDCLYENVATYKTVVRAKFGSDHSGRRYNVLRNTELKNHIRRVKPDVILNHDQSNNSIVLMLMELGFPSITFVHNCPEVIGGIAGLGYVAAMEKYSLSGGSVVNVSETSMHSWVGYTAKTVKDVQDPSSIFNRWCHLPWYNSGQINSDEGYGIMVSRISEDKRIHMVVKAHSKQKRRLKLCYVEPRNETEAAYLEKIHANADPTYIEFLPELPRDELMAQVGKASHICVAGPESFALTVSEAFMYGVPVMLFHSKEHPADEIAKHVRAEEFLHRVDRKMEIPDVSSTLDERRVVSSSAAVYFAKREAYTRLMNEVEFAIKKGEMIHADVSLF